MNHDYPAHLLVHGRETPTFAAVAVEGANGEPRVQWAFADPLIVMGGVAHDLPDAVAAAAFHGFKMNGEGATA